MPGPVNGNYLYHRVIQENSVWLLAACSRLWHTTSLDDSAQGRDHHRNVDILFRGYALPMSNATYSGPQDQPSLLPAAGKGYQSDTQRVFNGWRIATRDERSRDVVYQSLCMMCALLLAHGCMLQNKLDDFQHIYLRRSRSQAISNTSAT